MWNIIMKQNFKFDYPKSMRSLIDEKRHYEIKSTKLPSVTTILSATMTEDKKKALDLWKERVCSVPHRIIFIGSYDINQRADKKIEINIRACMN